MRVIMDALVLMRYQNIIVKDILRTIFEPTHLGMYIIVPRVLKMLFLDFNFFLLKIHMVQAKMHSMHIDTPT